MDPLARAVEAADGPWPVFAIAIIGLYVLIWRFGGQLLRVAQENNGLARGAVTTATKAHQQIREVSEQIVTNHGSKNLGDAIDRLSEWMLLHLEESRNSDEALSTLRSSFVQHIAETDAVRTTLTTTLTEIDERLAALEAARQEKKV